MAKYLDDFYNLLRDRADRWGKVQVNQVHLANELHCTQPHISAMLKKLCDAGKVKLISRARDGVGVYSVRSR